ncbi:BMP family ABC transporter substrate-binding protein [Paenarthrobacter sp. PH39-S1]|uniref:BMP family lipoprotein n=1 Tax=Paenarthrobacter sp. PH39-S1 TaxID=3046204 RepID=UPI0024BABAD2|nr:BMP family ABC transporter substrate-binding protein [Paenarthrobacter sp. PH39-S1]MDJ0354721.1 BMP family ABC transporter substrate-binding protein [Paenarthrobacter sp. PH39-S1]
MSLPGALKRSATVGTITLGATALLLTGCGAAPAPSGGGTAGASDYLGCIVSDAGGFDDQSFNQSSYEGLKKTQTDLGIKIKQAESTTKADFEPNLNQMANAGCNLTFTVGFLLADATKKVATSDASAHFAIIDDNSINLPNVKPVVYDTAQAAFLAGYASAAQTKTGKVGTFGGINIPTVTIFMDGFADGVKYYNEKKGKSVQLLGWDKKTQQGVFTNTFDVVQEGTKATNNLLNDGADIIMPVAGPLGKGAGDAILAANTAGKDAKLVWVDSDGYLTAPAFKAVLLTSVMKKMGEAVENIVKDDKDGKFDPTPYVGTLENDGVALAPFHDLDSSVTADTKSELDAIRKDIISGTLKIESPASPKK